MEFEAADVANAAMGNQFIADLMPRHPIYVALLPKAARDTLGRPHDNAAPAFNMLLKEGFSFRGYIDVFDGGPLVDARIDEIKTVQERNPQGRQGRQRTRRCVVNGPHRCYHYPALAIAGLVPKPQR